VKIPVRYVFRRENFFDIARLLPDAPVSFKKEEKEWSLLNAIVKVSTAGNIEGNFSGITNFQIDTFQTLGAVLKSLIERTIFAITQEEGRYTLSGGKIRVRPARRKDGDYRWASVALVRLRMAAKRTRSNGLDVLIPRRPGRLTKMTVGFRRGNRARC